MVVPAVVLLPLAAVPVEAPLLPMPPPPPIMLPPPRPKFDPVWASTGSDVPASTAVIRAMLKHLPRIANALVNSSSVSLENARHPVPRPSRTEGRAAPRGFTICGIPAAIPAAAWRPACPPAVSRPHWPALCWSVPGTKIDEKSAARPYRPPFPADSRADQRARPCFACHRLPDDRSSRPGIRRSRQGDRRRHEAGVPDPGHGRRLSLLRHRRVGGGARQHPVAGRPGADVRDRPFCHIVAADGDPARARHRGCPRGFGGGGGTRGAAR